MSVAPRRPAAVLLLLLTLLSGALGCRQLGQLGYFFSPRQWQEARFELTQNRLAILIDGVAGREDHPLFRRGLHDKTAELLAEHEINDAVAPYSEQLELAARHPDYADWSIQKIGRELGAEQAIHIQLVEFELRETPTHPLLNPSASVRVKVIDVNAQPRLARLWPDDVGGHAIEVERRPREARSIRVIDAEAEKLGKDLAQHVARLFFKYDTEERIPTEPE